MKIFLSFVFCFLFINNVSAVTTYPSMKEDFNNPNSTPYVFFAFEPLDWTPNQQEINQGISNGFYGGYYGATVHFNKIINDKILNTLYNNVKINNKNDLVNFVSKVIVFDKNNQKQPYEYNHTFSFPRELLSYDNDLVNPTYSLNISSYKNKGALYLNYAFQEAYQTGGSGYSFTSYGWGENMKILHTYLGDTNFIKKYIDNIILYRFGASMSKDEFCSAVACLNYVPTSVNYNPTNIIVGTSSAVIVNATPSQINNNQTSQNTENINVTISDPKENDIFQVNQVIPVKWSSNDANFKYNFFLQDASLSLTDFSRIISTPSDGKGIYSLSGDIINSGNNNSEILNIKVTTNQFNNPVKLIVCLSGTSMCKAESKRFYIMNSTSTVSQVNQTQTCPNGTQVSVGQVCPITTQTCWNGTIIPTTQACPAQTQTCSNGTVVYVGQICPSQTINQTNNTTQADIPPQDTQSQCLILQNNFGNKSNDAKTNSEVSLLQNYLQEKGYFNQEPTGYFGLITKRALSLFQMDNNLSGTGFLGNFTRAKIKELSCK